MPERDSLGRVEDIYLSGYWFVYIYMFYDKMSINRIAVSELSHQRTIYQGA